MDKERLAELSLRTLDGTAKGLPLGSRAELQAAQVKDQAWNLLSGDLDYPVLVVKDSAVTNNIAVMAQFCRDNRVDLAPHGKTTMSPQLFARQADAGAWAITAATAAHCRTYRTFGVSRILLANTLVDPDAIRWVAGELAADPEFEFLFYVDSLAGIEIAESALAELDSPPTLSALVELGYQGGRSGCRTVAEALEIAKRVSTSSYLRLAGVAGFEGLIPGAGLEERRTLSYAFLSSMHELAEAVHAAGLISNEHEFIVTAGGSALFDVVVAILGPQQFTRTVRTVLRSGCYVTHDAEMYELTSPLAGKEDNPAGRLQAAFELWATVWSRPEPGLAILGFGKRDAPYDYGLPLPLKAQNRRDGTVRDLPDGCRIFDLNDQHAFLELSPADPLEVGDHVMVGISHPCGAFDKWRFIPVVDDDYTVIDGLWTFF